MTLPAAGWYPDPDNTQRSRWWNGAAWTDSYSDYQTPSAEVPAFAAPAYAAPAYAAPAYGAPQATPPTAQMAPYDYSASTSTLTAPAGTPWSTVWIWIIVGIPVLSNLSILAIDWRGMVTASSEDAIMSMMYSPAYFIVTFLGFIAYGLGVWFAYLDYRVLQRRGVPKPFHWAWGFLNNYLVYTIGRSVVVKRRTGRGISPMWVSIAIFVGTVVFYIVFFVSFIMAIVQYNTGSYGF